MRHLKVPKARIAKIWSATEATCHLHVAAVEKNHLVAKNDSIVIFTIKFYRKWFVKFCLDNVANNQVGVSVPNRCKFLFYKILDVATNVNFVMTRGLEKEDDEG